MIKHKALPMRHEQRMETVINRRPESDRYALSYWVHISQCNQLAALYLI